MRARLFSVWAVLAGISLVSGRAEACGGCFAPPIIQSDVPVITGHRMTFSVNPTRTVLWDQFEYTGSPQDFPGSYR